MAEMNGRGMNFFVPIPLPFIPLPWKFPPPRFQPLPLFPFAPFPIRVQSARLTMPKRTDIHSVLIIGAGPIIIGQACEFDYSGTQACKALREEGYRVVLVNSNPATIMTDPEF